MVFACCFDLGSVKVDHAHNPNFRLPRGIGYFPSIRQYDRIYVDKTESIFRIANRYGVNYFLRPGRFGKSLLVSTIESLFEDGLKYFLGLAIAKPWDESAARNRDCTVPHLDFSCVGPFETGAEFETCFGEDLQCFMADHPCGHEPAYRVSRSAIRRFDFWLEERRKTVPGNPVPLVDKYDTPRNHCFADPKLYREVAAVLRRFFSIVKSENGAFRLIFVTGICRYPIRVLDPAPNYLSDFGVEYAELAGFTEEEIRKYFSPYVERAAETLNLSFEECLSA